MPCIMRWPEVMAAGQSNTELATAMDFFATLSHISGAQLPDDRVIDSKNIYPLMIDTSAKSEMEYFGYYWLDELQAIRCGDWKLQLWRDQCEVKELYNLREDIGERNNLYSHYPDLIVEMEGKAQKLRQDIGDTAKGKVSISTTRYIIICYNSILSSQVKSRPFYIFWTLKLDFTKS